MNNLTFLQMKHFLTCIVLIIIHLEITGQEWIITDDFNNIEHQLRRDMITETPYIDGSPYLNDEFVSGKIITTDSLLYKNVPLRYNIFNDDMEILIGSSQDPRVITDPRNYLYFSINERSFSYYTYTERNSAQQGYFEVLNKGYCQVLVRRRVIFEDREQARGYADAKPARFEEMPDQYYLKFGDKIPVEVRLRRRAILNVFGDKRQEISDFIRDQNLNFRNVDDLVRVADYYNKLFADQK